jgi:hypothetical protein
MLPAVWEQRQADLLLRVVQCRSTANPPGAWIAPERPGTGQ